MKHLLSTLAVSALVATAAVPATAQQQPMQQRLQQMQDRMGQIPGQPGTMGPGMMGHGMMGHGIMGQGMMAPGMMAPGMMGPGMMGPGMMGPGQMGPGRFVEGRLAFLKTELGITADQEGLWDDFAAAVRANAGSMQEMHDRMWSDEGWPETLAERLELHEEMMSARLTALRSLREALVPLYESFSDAQKRTADTLMGMGTM